MIRAGRSAAAVLCGLGAGAPTTAGAQEALEARFEQGLVPALARCSVCHSGSDPDAGLDLARFRSADDVLREESLWRHAVDRVAAGQMPPFGTAPDDFAADRDFVAQVEGLFRESFDARRPIQPGRPVLRRLAPREIGATVRDVFGVAVDACGWFPPEAPANGFDNQGVGQHLSDLWLERAFDLAEHVAREAVRDPREEVGVRTRFTAAELTGGGSRGDHRVLTSSGSVVADAHAPRAGRYSVAVDLSADQAGVELARARVGVDGQLLGRCDVREQRGDPERFAFEVELADGGPLGLEVAFVNDHWDPDHPDPERRDRNLHVHAVELEGPLDPRPPTAFQSALAGRQREHADPMDNRLAISADLGRRVWRRPLDAGECARLAGLAPEDEPLAGWLRTAIVDLLVAPEFLFRFERAPVGARGVRRLDDFELATRLAFMITGSTPDEVLLDEAEAGRLGTDEVLRHHALRLLDGPHGSALATGFASQWLGLTGLTPEHLAPEVTSELGSALLGSMRRECELLFEAVVRERRSLWELLEADFTFVDAPLAAHYGLPDPGGPGTHRVSLAHVPRRGLIGTAAVLTLTSDPARTNPSRRGKWILETLLGSPPPPPPPGVDDLSEAARLLPDAGIEARLALHRRDARCAACHARIDPLGLALEGFGPRGEERTRARSAGLDDVVRQLVVRDAPVHEPGFLRSLVESFLVYALGRGLGPADRPLIAQVHAALDPYRPTFEQLLLAVVTSDAFRSVRCAHPEHASHSD